MTRSIKLVNLSSLIGHEKVDKARLKQVTKDITTAGCIKHPVVVDKKSLVILDGHHRLHALKKLGYKKIPVVFVNYFDPQIKIYLRRKNLLMPLLKEIVVLKAKQGQIFPHKTTRYYLPKRLNVNISLEVL